MDSFRDGVAGGQAFEGRRDGVGKCLTQYINSMVLEVNSPTKLLTYCLLLLIEKRS